MRWRGDRIPVKKLAFCNKSRARGLYSVVRRTVWMSPSSTRCRWSSSNAFARLATTILATAFPIKFVEGACVDPRYLLAPTTHPRGEARQACCAPSERGRRVADNYRPASATRHQPRSLEAFQHSSSRGQRLHPTAPTVVSRNPHPCASLQQA